MELKDLRPAEGSTKNRKRVGRGPASGTGKTAGRGMNGQKSRAGGGKGAGFEAGDVVDGESLKAKGIIKHADALVKVLGDGEITKALTVRVDKVSASAKAKIEAAGGNVEELC